MRRRIRRKRANADCCMDWILAEFDPAYRSDGVQDNASLIASKKHEMNSASARPPGNPPCL